MEKLNEKLWIIVKEYTMQTAKLLECSEWHWIGTDDDGLHPISICDFDGAFFLSLEDMQIIIDRMPEWLKKYGSKEAVAQEIVDWFDWWLSDPDNLESSHPLIEIYESRLHRALRTHPDINLEHWLMGCPRVPHKPSLDDKIRLLECQCAMVSELSEKYRSSRTLWNVFDNLSAELKELRAKKKKIDEKLMNDMKQTEAYKNFEQAIKNHTEHGGEF